MSDFRDLHTGHAKERTCACVQAAGFAHWYADYEARAALLTEALARYNNGRMKRYLCELFLQWELPALQALMRRAAGLEGDAKALGAAFRALVEETKEAGAE